MRLVLLPGCLAAGPLGLGHVPEPQASRALEPVSLTFQGLWPQAFLPRRFETMQVKHAAHAAQ